MDTQPQGNNEPAADSRHPVVKWIEKNKLTLSGFFGWYVVNGLIWRLLGNSTTNEFAIIMNACLFPLNLLVPSMLAITKPVRKIALGILLALAVNFLISLVLGILFNGICFVPFFIPAQ